jgi:hypothetical protein
MKFNPSSIPDRVIDFLGVGLLLRFGQKMALLIVLHFHSMYVSPEFFAAPYSVISLGLILMPDAYIAFII